MTTRTSTTEIQLPIEGMTCGSCVNRIERFLRATDGVEEANVNLATEMATIRYLPDLADKDRLVAAVEAAGYDVRQVEPTREDVDPVEAAGWSLIEEAARDDGRRDREAAVLLRQAITSIVVAVAIMVMMFVPQTRISMETLNWIALVPATVIQFVAGRRF
jgi:P-type Cu+ transporter